MKAGLFPRTRPAGALAEREGGSWPTTAVRAAGRRVVPRANLPAAGAAPGPWRAALLGTVCGTVLALFTLAPARWLAEAVAAGTQGRVVLSESQGTVWQGHAVLTLTGGPGSRDAWTLPGRLGWTLGVDWRGLRVAVSQDCCLPAPMVWYGAGGLGDLSLTLSTTRTDAPLAQWPAAWLAALGTPWNTLQPAGLVRLSSPGLRVGWAQGRWQFDGALRADFVGMSSRLSTLPVLGSYRVDLTAGGASGAAVPTLTIVTVEGPLQLSGQGQWAGDRWRLRGEARAGAGSAAALQNLLNLIGRREGERAILSIG